MKFKSKSGDWILLFSSAAAIILSIVLWIFIMTNDQRFSQLNQSDSSITQQARMRNNKSVYDLYTPTSVYGFKDGKLYSLYSSKYNILLAFSKAARQMKVQRIDRLAASFRKYEEYLNNQNFVQLTYPDEITFNLFSDASGKKDNRQFNRIFVSKTNDDIIYFGNDKTDELYKISVKKANFDQLRRYIEKADYKTTVKFVKLKFGYTTFYTQEERWRVYSYLVNEQPNSYFVARLLGNSGVSSRTNKRGRTTYSLNYSTRLSVPKSESKNNDYLYTRYEKTHYKSMTDKLLDSVYYVHRLGLNEQDLRFFDADNNNIKYTNYVEGTPVFLNEHDVQVNSIFSPDSVEIGFNSTNLQIPIPFDGRRISLPPTQEIVDQLKNHGIDKNEIESIVVGSRVEKDASRDNLVNLIPTYYVKAFGRWMSLNEWLAQDVTLYKNTERGGIVNNGS